MLQVLGIILGLIMVVGGGYLIRIWYYDLWTVFKGVIGLTLLVIGVGVFAFAISSIKESMAEKRREKEEAEKAKAEEAKAAEVKPEEAKPEEAKPEEAKPQE